MSFGSLRGFAVPESMMSITTLCLMLAVLSLIAGTLFFDVAGDSDGAKFWSGELRIHTESAIFVMSARCYFGRANLRRNDVLY